MQFAGEFNQPGLVGNAEESALNLAHATGSLAKESAPFNGIPGHFAGAMKQATSVLNLFTK